MNHLTLNLCCTWGFLPLSLVTITMLFCVISFSNLSSQKVLIICTAIHIHIYVFLFLSQIHVWWCIFICTTYFGECFYVQFKTSSPKFPPSGSSCFRDKILSLCSSFVSLSNQAKMLQTVSCTVCSPSLPKLMLGMWWYYVCWCCAFYFSFLNLCNFLVKAWNVPSTSWAA